MNIKYFILSLFVAIFMVISPVMAGERINVNTATVEQLEALPGIGSTIAAAIVAYRHEHGGFSSVDALIHVKGIGEKKFASIRDAIEVRADKAAHITVD